MLFTTEEKYMVIGAVSTSVLDGILVGYLNSHYGGVPPAQSDPLYYLYASFNEWIPPTNKLVALVGFPLLFYGFGKMRKSAKAKSIGLGGMLFGFSETIGWIALKGIRTAGGS